MSASAEAQDAMGASVEQAPSHERDEALRRSAPTVSVVIPCLNEAGSIARCIAAARGALERVEVPSEVIVVDNASSDGSGELAELAGARVVHEPRRGYGSAYLAGFAAARGTYIVMADADLTYDFEEIPRFLSELEDGADMVIGNRMDNIQPGAMPWHHRYIGNPLLSGLLNLLFHTGVGDAHCGMRALRADRLGRLGLRTTGMEFASEMVVRAARSGLRISELAIEYHPRAGESKLSSMRDGWRHLRFLLLHSPNHLFILPGAIVSAVGALISAMVLARIDVLGRRWDLHALIGGSLLLIAGAQIVSLGLCAHAYATYFMGERDWWFDRIRARMRLEHGLMLGATIMGVGAAMLAAITLRWVVDGFGSLSQERTAVAAATLLVLGLQVIFSSFLLSILGLRRGSA
jgi:glycosyltransferase involved in cell wall biosynthesis